MTVDILATVLTGAVVLLGVWRMVDSSRRDLSARVDGVRSELAAQIAAVNTRIDNILLANRGRATDA